MKLKAELLVLIFVSIFILFSCATTKPSTSFIESDEVQKKQRKLLRLQRRVFQKRSFQVLNRVYCKK